MSTVMAAHPLNLPQLDLLVSDVSHGCVGKELDTKGTRKCPLGVAQRFFSIDFRYGDRWDKRRNGYVPKRRNEEFTIRNA